MVHVPLLSSVGWCRFFPLLLGGATNHLSSVGWCCLPSPPLGSCAVLSLRSLGWCFSGKQPHPGGGGGGQHDLKTEEQPHPQEERASTTEREEEGPPLN